MSDENPNSFAEKPAPYGLTHMDVVNAILDFRGADSPRERYLALRSAVLVAQKIAIASRRSLDRHRTLDLLGAYDRLSIITMSVFCLEPASLEQAGHIDLGSVKTAEPLWEPPEGFEKSMVGVEETLSVWLETYSNVNEVEGQQGAPQTVTDHTILANVSLDPQLTKLLDGKGTPSVLAELVTAVGIMRSHAGSLLAISGPSPTETGEVQLQAIGLAAERQYFELCYAAHSGNIPALKAALVELRETWAPSRAVATSSADSLTAVQTPPFCP